MSGSRHEDYLLRQVRALAAMLARIAGLRVSGQEEAARAELARAYDSVIGSESELLRRLDAGTAATLLGSADRILAFAQLLNEESMLERDSARAVSLRLRALALGLEAALRDRENAAARQFLESVAPLIRRDDLTAEQRTILDDLLEHG